MRFDDAPLPSSVRPSADEHFFEVCICCLVVFVAISTLPSHRRVASVKCGKNCRLLEKDCCCDGDNKHKAPLERLGLIPSARFHISNKINARGET